MSITPYTKIKNFKLSDSTLANDSITQIVSDQIAIEYCLSGNRLSKTKLLEPVRLVEGSNQIAINTPRTVLADDFVLANEESQLNGLNKNIVHCSQYPVNDNDIAPKCYVYDCLLAENVNTKVAAFLMKDSITDDIYSITIEKSKIKLRKIEFNNITE